MTGEANGLRDEIARVIHEAECVAYTHEGRNARCEREARALLPLFERVQAEAARDAVIKVTDAWQQGGWAKAFPVPTGLGNVWITAAQAVTDWLRNRANSGG